MFTGHGHHIPGTALEARPKGMVVARCGGPQFCDSCAHDVAVGVSSEDLKDRLTDAKSSDDPAINPKHYKSNPSGIECIEVSRHFNFNLGNVIKYLWREGLKDGEATIQELEKAAWYLQDEIEQRKREQHAASEG